MSIEDVHERMRQGRDELRVMSRAVLELVSKRVSVQPAAVVDTELLDACTALAGAALEHIAVVAFIERSNPVNDTERPPPPAGCTCPVCGAPGMRDRPDLPGLDATCSACGWYFSSPTARQAMARIVDAGDDECEGC